MGHASLTHTGVDLGAIEIKHNTVPFMRRRPRSDLKFTSNKNQPGRLYKDLCQTLKQKRLLTLWTSSDKGETGKDKFSRSLRGWGEGWLEAVSEGKSESALHFVINSLIRPYSMKKGGWSDAAGVHCAVQ